jgi:hypothetical protein
VRNPYQAAATHTEAAKIFAWHALRRRQQSYAVENEARKGHEPPPGPVRDLGYLPRSAPPPEEVGDQPNGPRVEDVPTVGQERAFGYLVRQTASETGNLVPPEVWQKSREQERLRREQSVELARRLESLGVSSFDKSEPVWCVGLCSGLVEQVTCGVKRNSFFPSEAARKRSRMIQFLELLLSRKQFQRSRLMVVSGGRCTVDQLRNRLQVLSRACSALNAEPWFRDVGGQILFRSLETGKLFDDDGRPFKDDDGRWTFHPHANLIYRVRFLGEGLWEAFLARCRSFLQARIDAEKEIWVKEAGRLHNVREACKYVAKPEDVLALDDDTLLAFYHAVHGLHRVQPLGPLRTIICKAREANKIPDRPCALNKWRWRLIRNPNAGDKGRDDLTEGEKTEAKDGKDPAKEALPWSVVAYGRPSTRLSRVAEPVAYVRAAAWHPEYSSGLRRAPRAVSLVIAACPGWHAGLVLAAQDGACAGQPMPHTLTVTVGKARTAEPLPPVQTPLFGPGSLAKTLETAHAPP